MHSLVRTCLIKLTLVVLCHILFFLDRFHIMFCGYSIHKHGSYIGGVSRTGVDWSAAHALLELLIWLTWMNEHGLSVEIFSGQPTSHAAVPSYGVMAWQFYHISYIFSLLVLACEKTRRSMENWRWNSRSFLFSPLESCEWMAQFSMALAGKSKWE